MPKGGGKRPIFALLNAFNVSGCKEVSFNSEIGTPKKLLPGPHANPPTSPRIFSSPKESPNRSLSFLAEKFVLQLNKASASKTSEEPHAPVQESCADVTREIFSIIPSSDKLDLPVSQSNFVESCSNQYLNGVGWKKKETSRFRKQKVLQNSKKSRQFLKLMKLCVDKLDIESTIGVFGRVGRELNLKEYNTLIILWIEKARQINGDDSLGYFQKVYHLFISMKERGFQILEDSYGPFLLYLIEMRMMEEFQLFTEFIKNYDHDSCDKLGYYEMLLWIKFGDRCKIKELCNSIIADKCNVNNKLAESYLLALCENDVEEDLIHLLGVFNVKSISSLEHASCIFKSIGRLHLKIL